MTEQTEPTTWPVDASPAGVAHANVIEAVTRGVVHALAGHDDVRGYAVFGQDGLPVVVGSLGGVVFCPPPPKQGARLDRLPDVRSQAHG